MASHEIAALQCPSCGGSNTGPSTPLAFGAEFTCANCGGTSVLIVNSALLPLDALERTGDKVCAVCGRVAKHDADFCQGGHKLVRVCLNPDCRNEFAVHHRICDYCGWNQDVKPPKSGSVEASQAVLDRAIVRLSDVIEGNIPENELAAYGIPHSILSNIKSTWDAYKLGKSAIPVLLSFLDITEQQYFLPQNADHRTIYQERTSQVWCLLAQMGPDAAEVVPYLKKRIDGFFEAESLDGWWYCKVLAMIAPHEALLYCRNAIEANGKKLEDYNSSTLPWLKGALQISKFVGKPAIPVLHEFCGAFSGRRGSMCKDAANEIAKNGRMGWSGPVTDEPIDKWFQDDD